MMSNHNKLVEKKIQDAMKAGKFDNLAGKGEPIKLDENPFEDASMRAAFRLLKNNNFTLPWIEEQRAIEATIDGLRADLARSWAVYHETRNSRRGSVHAEDDWQHALSGFRRRIAALNLRIAAYNLRTPSTTFHRLPLDAEREISRTVMSDKR
jgi:DnaJ family protein C protein 28